MLYINTIIVLHLPYRPHTTKMPPKAKKGSAKAKKPANDNTAQYLEQIN